jgi:hypothetical protein
MPPKAKAKVQGHPATSEIEYTAAELEFMAAVERWQNRTGRRHPSWRELLEIVRSLGYVRAAA